MFEKLEKEIRCYIQLHNNLKELVIGEKNLFDDNKLDDLSEGIEKRKQIEMEIVNAGKTITSLFEPIQTGNVNINDSEKIALSALLEELHANIRSTMNIVDQAERFLVKMKKETFSELKKFERRKEAINSYSKAI